MKRTLLTAILVAAAGTIACDRTIEDPNILYLIKGEVVTVTEFRRNYEEWLSLSGRSDSPGMRRAYLASRIEDEVLYQKGKMEGVEYLPEIKEKIAEYRRQLIIKRMREMVDLSLHSPSEETVRRYYVEHRAEFVRDKMYRLYAVRTKDKDRAYEVYRKMTEEGFSVRLLAAQYSDDKRLADMNGDWGLFSEDTMDEAWKESVLPRKIGDIVGPVRDSEQYWTVIEIAGYAYRREIPFERAYPLIVRALTEKEGEEKQRAYRQRLLREYGVRINEQNLFWKTP